MMLSTALSLDADDTGGRIAQWRQLVDLVVQAKGDLAPRVRTAALDRIAALRAAVPAEQRRSAAIQSAARAHAPDAVALFASDEPVVAAPVLGRATMSGAQWCALIPKLPATSRALLRNRRDLPDEAVRALASYGLSDFGLPRGDSIADDSGNQIRELVARIEAFRLGSAGTSAAPEDVPRAVQDFAFETTPQGLFDWIAGAPREALIGMSVAEIADAGGFGVDGQAAGAFRRRAPFRDARLLVAGAGPTGGDWRISAAPVFNPHDGRFAGYHGTARRPRGDEVAGGVARFAGTTVPVDSLRQLIHELRTPLNAILGFAEMIDRQLLGPAALVYREQAQAIVQDGERLIAMVDDLDDAARAKLDDAHNAGASDLSAILARIETALGATMAARGTMLAVPRDTPIAATSVDAASVERLLTRLISASLGLADAGETIPIDLAQTNAGQVQISVARPKALALIEDAVLLDPGYDPAMPYPDAPLLGLGFTLRLTATRLREFGGRLAITPTAFVMTLPQARAQADLPAGTP